VKKFSILLLALALNAFAQQTTVAVLPSDGDTEAFSNDDFFALTDKVRSVALKTLPHETFILLTQDVVVKRLGGAENFIKECRESSCIVDLGKKAQVDYVAQANIGKLRNKMRIRVEVYDVATSGLVGIYDGNGEYFDDYFNLLDAVEKHVPDIFKKIPGVVPTQAKAGATVSSLSKYSSLAQAEPARPAPPPPQQYVPQQYIPPEKPVVIVNSAEQKEKVQKLIKNGLKKNKYEIQKESSNLSLADREALFGKNKKRGAAGFVLLDFTVGFGLGSYIQGDVGFGVTQTILDGIGWGLILVSNSNEDEIISEIMLLGALTIVTSRIMSWIFPFTFQASYNKKLKGALNLDKNISYSIDPLIIPANGAPALGLAFNLRY